ncbi:MAG: CinA family nicotinamide mononucleotide deamidase-related protein [Acidobacteria bacterium]|nr:CinA family nicotinamide mononucleotide deamidase-related protein [Acidobacteriota bacterium]NIM62063.1 CinA family nicotinamide mononucleotide deamidase-related protein [Acidobacteriota bacterium]NIO59712.1 CinA family nicotinamide mononucleotide deamidase-related protein [Acidobacteriota bacterium]NIQ30801.1 CinA family nicotinamide mononucleotide deamidase-related protein [Acidobacteriota bacterium]NIQ85863.1 CinA family nicotinamide mononucleotide deamidase-related protein [Acidobacterio
MKRAALIAVGSELLRFDRSDTNTVWLTEQLDRLGIETVARLSLPDEPATISRVLSTLVDSSDLVILTGGLGPTEDDRTRDALSLAAGRELQHDPDKERDLRARFAAVEVRWTDRQARQAWRPRGASWIINPAGSADGLILEHGGTTIVALPGVPSEMKPMVSAHLEAWVGTGERQRVLRSVLRTFGRGEAAVEAKIADLYDQPGIEVTVLSSPGEVTIAIQASDTSSEIASKRLEATRAAMLQRLGGGVLVDDERPLAEIVGNLLLEAGQTLAVAESCTGGMLAAEATAVPGSSRWFRGGWVVYSDDLKRDLAGVDPALLERHGAVSEPVGRQLAASVRRRCGADWGVGITGIAGPGGGSAGKPVGLVHVALASATGTEHWRTVRPGGRQGVRRGSVIFALEQLRRALVGRER